MGNFRSDRGFGGNRSSGRSGGFGGGGFGGRREGGFGGNRGGRSFGGRPEMHDATCAKCGEDCQVPFRPTGEKPVLCSNCFRKGGDSGSMDNPRPRRDNFSSRESNTESSSGSAGISQEQFKRLDAKLDKILGILDQLEFEEEDAEEDELDEDETEEDSDKEEIKNKAQELEKESEEDSEEETSN